MRVGKLRSLCWYISPCCLALYGRGDCLPIWRRSTAEAWQLMQSSQRQRQMQVRALRRAARQDLLTFACIRWQFLPLPLFRTHVWQCMTSEVLCVWVCVHVWEVCVCDCYWVLSWQGMYWQQQQQLLQQRQRQHWGGDSNKIKFPTRTLRNQIQLAKTSNIAGTGGRGKLWSICQNTEKWRNALKGGKAGQGEREGQCRQQENASQWNFLAL